MQQGSFRRNEKILYVPHPDLRTNHASAGTASWQPRKTCARPYDSAIATEVRGLVSGLSRKHMLRGICVQFPLQSMDDLTGARYESAGYRKGVPYAIAVWAASVSCVAFPGEIRRRATCTCGILQQQCRGVDSRTRKVFHTTWF